MRLALSRPEHHPLAQAVREAGWQPVPYFPTHIQTTGNPPPIRVNRATAVMILSPAGAEAAAWWLPEGTTVLVTGEGTAAALDRPGLEIVAPEQPKAEALWELLQSRFPEGGEFLLVRGHRSREALEKLSSGSKWEIHPWITHAEMVSNPVPPLPPVNAVLALSPVQALALLEVNHGVKRFAWGESAAKVFAEAGAPADAVCEPKAEALRALLDSRRG
ncbi:MAG TPA: uroporphyrinogen-III synthase [Holophagaceae bacterium]|nr:uroporphyrinogen-III synthase [Holophagaceae bacterium]